MLMTKRFYLTVDVSSWARSSMENLIPSMFTAPNIQQHSLEVKRAQRKDKGPREVRERSWAALCQVVPRSRFDVWRGGTFGCGL